jgi:hypothetical protein
MDNEAALRVWDRHPDLVVHQGVEMVVAGIHLSHFQRRDGFVLDILDTQGMAATNRPPHSRRPFVFHLQLTVGC